jgi:hypothetical protein
MIAAAIGLVLAIRRRLWPELLRAVAFVAYVILVARGNSVHDYYQVAIVPVAIMLVTIGVKAGSDPCIRRNTRMSRL